MTNWEGKNVTVFGLGKSSVAIAKKLSSLSAHVFLTELSPIENFQESVIDEIKNLGVEIETSGHSEKYLEKAELVVLSPGVNPRLEILAAARRKNIPVISEVELACRFFTKPIIAVTGTNGKTTTAVLIGEFLNASNKCIAVAGNIGMPLVSVDDKNLDFIVAEISSYQLETIVAFRPWIGLILNLTEDHLSRHGNMAEYGRTKAKLFFNQRKNDYLIYNADDSLIVDMVLRSEAKLVPFSKKYAQEFFNFPASEIKIKGEHNLENAMAAAAAAKLAGVSSDVIAKVLKEFPGIEHRIEFICEKDGIKFYNDSKATNPNSTIVALKALGSDDRRIVLILGGRDKETDLTQMCNIMKTTVKKAVLIGEAAQRFEAELLKNGFTAIEKASNLESAAALAFALSKKGDIVLLSPACASFDMFSNFEDRGNQFKTLVRNL